MRKIGLIMGIAMIALAVYNGQKSGLDDFFLCLGELFIGGFLVWRNVDKKARSDNGD